MSKIANKEGTQMGQQGSFTPGPWTVEKCSNGELDIAGAMNEAKARPVITKLGIGGDYWKNTNYPKTQEANARLIASAPELLEACKTMMEAMAYLQEHDKLPDDTCPADLYTLAYEVIAKAEGRAQG